MFMSMVLMKIGQIVQLLVLISILTVYNIFIYLIELFQSISYLDTAHGPKDANITSRHVGDLGNITTDATGQATLSISDKIIQFYNSTQDIANRTIVVHISSDDGGFGTGDSNTTG